VTCQELHARGVKIIAVADRFGAIQNPRGLDIPALIRHTSEGRLLRDFPGGEPMDPAELLTMPCTILVPAALERVIHANNARNLRCRILAEAANGPTTPEADLILSDSDIFIIPDVLCNAGGVTVSYFEWVQDIQQFFWDERKVNETLRDLMLRAFHQVVRLAKQREVSMRSAGLLLGIQKVANEKLRRGLFP
jgi:glutamate dehydrogenase (NAD(P)+)